MNTFFFKVARNYDIYYTMHFAKELSNFEKTIIVDLSSSDYFINIYKSNNDFTNIENIYKIKFKQLSKNLDLVRFSNLKENEFNDLILFLIKKYKYIVFLFNNDEFLNWNLLDNYMLFLLIDPNSILNFDDNYQNQIEAKILKLLKKRISFKIIFNSFDVSQSKLVDFYLTISNYYSKYAYDKQLPYSNNSQEFCIYLIDSKYYDKNLLSFFQTFIKKEIIIL